MERGPALRAGQETSAPRTLKNRYPVALRNDLYRLLTRALQAPEGERGYIKERVPRYLGALEDWGRRPPPASLASALALAEVLFNRGLFFDCHEFLESLWRQARGPRKRCLQGIIQIAAGFHKLEMGGSTRGALELLSQGAKKLESAPGPLGAKLAAKNVAKVKRALKDVSAGRFTLSKAPRLRLA